MMAGNKVDEPVSYSFPRFHSFLPFEPLMAGNKVGDEGARHLADALAFNATLTWLGLRGEVPYA